MLIWILLHLHAVNDCIANNGKVRQFIYRYQTKCFSLLCGRALIDVQETTAKIQEATGH